MQVIGKRDSGAVFINGGAVKAHDLDVGDGSAVPGLGQVGTHVSADGVVADLAVVDGAAALGEVSRIGGQTPVVGDVGHDHHVLPLVGSSLLGSADADVLAGLGGTGEQLLAGLDGDDAADGTLAQGGGVGSVDGLEGIIVVLIGGVAAMVGYMVDAGIRLALQPHIAAVDHFIVVFFQISQASLDSSHACSRVLGSPSGDGFATVTLMNDDGRNTGLLRQSLGHSGVKAHALGGSVVSVLVVHVGQTIAVPQVGSACLGKVDGTDSVVVAIHLTGRAGSVGLAVNQNKVDFYFFAFRVSCKYRTWQKRDGHAEY